MYIMLVFPALFIFQNKACDVLLHSKKVVVSLNGLYSISYILMPVFFRIIMSSDVILNSFIKYLYLFL